MNESCLQIGRDLVFLRHSDFKPGRPAILFVHGLGESSLCFQEAFEHPRLAGFNLLAPDLAGYGRSSPASDYSFACHLARLDLTLQHIESSGTVIDHLIVAGHSMGADLATLFCSASLYAGRIVALVNIEGDLTEHDLFISGKAVEADNAGRFDQWFENDFKRKMIYERLGGEHESCRRYHASLYLARPEAFLMNAKELCHRATSLAPPIVSEFGRKYIGLSAPKVFCFGENSLSYEAREFIKEHDIDSVSFANAFHWPMIDASDDFYRWFGGYAQSVTQGTS